jgi:hypothetical protein
MDDGSLLLAACTPNCADGCLPACLPPSLLAAHDSNAARKTRIVKSAAFRAYKPLWFLSLVIVITQVQFASIRETYRKTQRERDERERERINLVL